MKSQSSIFIYLLTILFFSDELLAENMRVIRGHASEIPISASYKSAIKDSGTLMDAMADQDDDFWILSQKNLIRWSVDEGSFRFLKIENLNQKSNPRTMTEAGDHQLMLAADSWFAIFNGENFDITWLRFPWSQSSSPSRLLSLGKSENNFSYIVHEKGVLRYHPDEKLEVLKLENFDLAQSTYACIDSKARFIYQILNKKLNIYDISNGTKSSPDNFTYLGVSCHSKDIVFTRSDAWYDVWKHGKKQHNIKLDSSRKILAKDIHESYHSFLFDDGLLDVFDLKNKKHLQFQLQKPASKIQKLLSLEKRILIVEDTSIKSYQLSWFDL